MNLDQAYEHLTSIRPCGPNQDAIRGATYDMLSGRPFEDFSNLPKEAYASIDEGDRYALQYRVLKLTS